jgi:hypothetical protein
MKIEDILKIGRAPNPDNNTTIKQGKMATALIAPFLDVIGLSINTTIAWPAEASMIPVAGLDLPEDVPLYLHVQVNGAGRVVDFGVANWLRIVASAGLHDAIVMCLAVATPDWATPPEQGDKIQAHQEYVARVAALPGVTPPAVVPDQPVAAMPDWDNPREQGVLGSRRGDHSPIGTEYVSPAGVKWAKGQWLSPFETTWKRV